jgi:hypothetical protein
VWQTNLIILPHSTTRILRKARTHASKFLVKHLSAQRNSPLVRGAYIQSAGHRKKRKMREKGAHIRKRVSGQSAKGANIRPPGRPPERRLSGHKNTHAAKTQHPQLNNSAAACGCVFFLIIKTDVRVRRVGGGGGGHFDGVFRARASSPLLF